MTSIEVSWVTLSTKSTTSIIQTARPFHTSASFIPASVPSASAKSNFTFNSQYSCEFIIATNAILFVADVVLVVVAVIRIILALNLHCTVFVEFGALFVATVFAFILGVALSIGVDITCDAVGKFYSSGCTDKPLPFTQVDFYPVLNATQAAMWFNFLFLFILTVIFVVRMVLYLRRQMRGRGGPLQQASNRKNMLPYLTTRARMPA
ncbi:hypothetical protein EMCRGX_G032427 [Ephydatia muelleri]